MWPNNIMQNFIHHIAIHVVNANNLGWKVLWMDNHEVCIIFLKTFCNFTPVEFIKCSYVITHMTLRLYMEWSSVVKCNCLWQLLYMYTAISHLSAIIDNQLQQRVCSLSGRTIVHCINEWNWRICSYHKTTKLSHNKWFG